MRIGNKVYRSIWLEDERLLVIDQRRLPFRLEVMELESLDQAVYAIREMVVRGAPLIGVTAAWGMWLAARESPEAGWQEALKRASKLLQSTRPTAVNLEYALELCRKALGKAESREKAIEILKSVAEDFTEEEVECSRLIGEFGLALIREIYQRKGSAVNILTHCNAGWLATVDYGTATAPMYMAHDKGIPLHVWVDETRPRNQGARLTAFELGEHGVPFTLIVDNAGGHLMQQGKVDLVIVGSDRTTKQGDVANKIGTYLKALAAKDNDIPFYVALPTSTIDRSLDEGKNIKIEEREEKEITHMAGLDEQKQESCSVRISPKNSPVANPGFDVTPARLVSGLITEKGLCEASKKGIASLFESGE